MYSCHTCNSLCEPKWKSVLHYVKTFGSIRLGLFCRSTDDIKLWSKLPIVIWYVIYVGHLHTAVARPVEWCSRSDFRDSCEPDFSKEHYVCIGRLRGSCSAKHSLEMEEETDWGQISRSDQQSYIKIETLWGKNPTEIHNALHKVCGDNVVDHSTVSRWASRFREGWVNIQDDPRSRRPVTAMDDTSVIIVSTLLEEVDANHVKKLRMKQTCQPLLFSELWLKHCRREKSLQGRFRISRAKNRKQLARESQKNCCGATRQKVSSFWKELLP